MRSFHRSELPMPPGLKSQSEKAFVCRLLLSLAVRRMGGDGGGGGLKANWPSPASLSWYPPPEPHPPDKSTAMIANLKTFAQSTNQTIRSEQSPRPNPCSGPPSASNRLTCSTPTVPSGFLSSFLPAFTLTINPFHRGDVPVGIKTDWTVYKAKRTSVEGARELEEGKKRHQPPKRHQRKSIASGCRFCCCRIFLLCPTRPPVPLPCLSNHLAVYWSGGCASGPSNAWPRGNDVWPDLTLSPTTSHDPCPMSEAPALGLSTPCWSLLQDKIAF
ncbi:unnamed protein product [Protopolystoma xenopodis]|uniref:Uncharacterized protein n=1 Tax=Protopolystoma xenopodis TaxID=117903 RepID=A0A3S5FCL9_9PLAT|nr:unnamed protein product [Protopolystoma xenopodis]